MWVTGLGYGIWLWLLLLTMAGARAQAPAWQMAMSVGPTTGVPTPVRGMATDANGNVYLVGSFSGTASFGTFSLTSAGFTDAFVAKWNPVQQVFTWAQQMGGTGSDEALAVAVSGSSVYVVGKMSSSAPVFGTITLSGAGSADGFVTKLTDAGPATNFAWARLVGGNAAEGLGAVAVQGNAVYVGGQFSSAALALDGIALTNTAGSANTSDGLVARLTDTGAAATFSWARSIGGGDEDYVRVLAVAGPVLYVGGLFASPTCAVGNVNVASAGRNDVFVVKYTDTGTAPVQAWVQTAGGPNDEGVNGMAVVGSSLYITGFLYSATAAFGSISLSNSSASGGNSDLYVAKLTDNGPTVAFAWAQQAGGPNRDNAIALTTQGTRFYVAGSIGNGFARFGSITLDNSGSLNSMVVARIDDLGSSGQWVWVLQAGNSRSDNAYAVAATPTGTVYLGGTVDRSASFGPFTVMGPFIGSIGFLASLNDGPLAVTAAQDMGSFSLLPNPARGTVTVRLPVLATLATFTLLDALARPVRRQNILPAAAGSEVVFDLTGIAPGVHALRVQASTYTATQKLVVE